MHPPAPTSFVLRPGVVAVIVYVGLAAVWGVWRICTATLPETGGDEPFRLLTTPRLTSITVLHAGLLLVLVAEGLVARRSGSGLRRGHLVGIALAVLVVALAQWGAVLAHAPIAAH